MSMKKAMALLLSASVCIFFAACREEPQIMETEEMTYADITHAIETEPASVAAMPETAATETTPAETVPGEPEDETLVAVKNYIPDILTELRYGSTDNFTGQVIYGFQDAYLRYGTVKKLKNAQDAFSEVGLRLKIWDAFRPASAQFDLWDACPDPTYVADPRKGFSNHTRGNAVDVTLVDKDGNELIMPTPFDDFSGKADRDYSDCTELETENAVFLESVMEKNGFKGYFGEWWHFADEVKYPVEENFDPTIG